MSVLWEGLIGIVFFRIFHLQFLSCTMYIGKKRIGVLSFNHYFCGEVRPADSAYRL